MKFDTGEQVLILTLLADTVDMKAQPLLESSTNIYWLQFWLKSDISNGHFAFLSTEMTTDHRQPGSQEVTGWRISRLPVHFC